MAGRWVWAAVLIGTGCSRQPDWSSQDSPSPAADASADVPDAQPVKTPMFDPAISRRWTWQECGTIDPNLPVLRAKFAPDAQTVAIQFQDGTIVLKAPEHLAPARVVLKGHGGDFAFSRDGSRLAEAGKSVSIFQTSDGALLKEISDPADYDCAPGVVALSDHGDDVLGYGSGPLCVWNVASGTMTAQLTETPDVLSSAAFRAAEPEEASIVVARIRNNDGMVDLRTYDLHGAELSRPTVETIGPSPEVRGGALVVSPGGEALGARVSTTDGKTAATVWSTRDGHLLTRREHTLDSRGNFEDVLFSPDGGMVALEGEVFETVGFRLVGRAPQSDLGQFSLSPKGDQAVSEIRGFAALSDAVSSRVRLLTNHPSSGRVHLPSIDIARDGRTLVVGTEGVVRWQLADHFADSDPAWVGGLPAGASVHVSPDGHFAATAGDGRYLANLDSGEYRFVGEPPPVSLVASVGSDATAACIWLGLRFSHNGLWVAGPGYGNAVDVFDVRTAARAKQLSTGGCNGKVVFSSDDRFLYTARGEKFETTGWNQIAKDISKDKLGPSDDVDISARDELLASTCPKIDADVTCITRLSGTILPGLTAPHARFSDEGNWIVAGGTLFHAPDQETRVFDSEARVATFAPNGDIISARRDGTLARYCRSDVH